MFCNTYRGRRVLVTGHTGFKGSWLSAWLIRLGAEVAGFSLDIPTEPSNFQVLDLRSRMAHYEGDVRDREALSRVMESFKPEIVFHLAAQAIVRRSFDEPAKTIETNTLGTLNVLECMRLHPSVLAGVIITSDKCYRNSEWVWGYRENDVLGGDDPYSVSKACAELISYAYMKSFFKGSKPFVATTRAGNVIGGGDWADDRIIPDCVRAWSQGRPLEIRNPNATRPWQHVLEPLSGYLWLGARLIEGDSQAAGEAFNFGPQEPVDHSVEEVINSMARHWSGGVWTAKDKKEIDDTQEATLLRLSCEKAMKVLGWSAILTLHETTKLTAEWYKEYCENGAGPMYEMTGQQIDEYMAKALEEGAVWTTR